MHHSKSIAWKRLCVRVEVEDGIEITTVELRIVVFIVNQDIKIKCSNQTLVLNTKFLLNS